jgi:hypothetical protein
LHLDTENGQKPDRQNPFFPSRQNSGDSSTEKLSKEIKEKIEKDFGDSYVNNEYFSPSKKGTRRESVDGRSAVLGELSDRLAAFENKLDENHELFLDNFNAFVSKHLLWEKENFEISNRNVRTSHRWSEDSKKNKIKNDSNIGTFNDDNNIIKSNNNNNKNNNNNNFNKNNMNNKNKNSINNERNNVHNRILYGHDKSPKIGGKPRPNWGQRSPPVVINRTQNNGFQNSTTQNNGFQSNRNSYNNNDYDNTYNNNNSYIDNSNIESSPPYAHYDETSIRNIR